MFKSRKEILDGNEITVISENHAVRCQVAANTLINHYKFSPELEVTPLTNSWESNLEIYPKHYSKLGSLIKITLSWKDDNYDIPPSTIELQMVNYEDESFRKKVEIQYTENGDYEDDVIKHLVDMLKILIKLGELKRWKN